LDIRWKAFPLHPHTPSEGLTLEALFAGQAVDLVQWRRRWEAMAQQHGLPFGHRTHTYNSRLAQELGKWAEKMGVGPTFHAAAFRTYFARGLNLAQEDELIRLATNVGLPKEEARMVLKQRSLGADVDQDWQQAKRLGITAVPTFRLNGRQLTGYQPYERLKAWLKS
jgi:predicted DsbA family dithiol-disulfide isomerase